MADADTGRRLGWRPRSRRVAIDRPGPPWATWAVRTSKRPGRPG